MKKLNLEFVKLIEPSEIIDFAEKYPVGTQVLLINKTGGYALGKVFINKRMNNRKWVSNNYYACYYVILPDSKDIDV